MIVNSVQLCRTLCDPMDCWGRPTGPPRILSPWGFSRQECWSELPWPPPGDLSYQETEPMSAWSLPQAGSSTRDTWEWLVSFTNSVDKHLSKLQEAVKDRGAWHAAVCGSEKPDTTRLTKIPSKEWPLFWKESHIPNDH